MDVCRYIREAVFTIMMVSSVVVHADNKPATQSGTKNAETIYQENCGVCHGKNMEGGIGSNLVDKIWNYGRDPELIWMNIKFGIPNLEMPGWKDSLNDAELEALVHHILEKESKSTYREPPVAQKAKTEEYDLVIEILDDTLEQAWSIAFISANTALVTDKVGKLYYMIDGKIQKRPISGLPENIVSTGQGGLMDVMLDPDYTSNGWVYLSYSHELEKANRSSVPGAMTRLIRGRIKDNAWYDQQVLFEASKGLYSTSRHHYGSRISFDDQGYLFFSIGDRGAKEQAQDISWPNGKVHRIHRDGRIPDNNPFVDTKKAITSIYSYGHRNPQGMAVHPDTKKIWTTEHGPMGGDELNVLSEGKNYGWPEITYGLNYDGSVISKYTEKPNMEQPVHHWTPSIAVSDIDFYAGALFPKWKNNLLVTSLKYTDLRRLVLEGSKLVHEEVLLKGVGRLRSVSVAPDGAVYILANDPSLILKLTPEK